MKIAKPAVTPEFRDLAVKRAKAGESVGGVAKELGLVEQTLRNWVKAAAKGTPNGVGSRMVTPEERELSRLRAENGIHARHKRRYKVTTDSRHALLMAENRLACQFTPTASGGREGFGMKINLIGMILNKVEDNMKSDMNAFKRANRPVYFAQQDPAEPLSDLLPHYTDSRFRDEQTIFGAPADDLSYDYSDRLHQWYGHEKMAAAQAAAEASGHAKHSAAWLSVWASHAHGYEVLVKHVVAGVNRSNGYPYFVLGQQMPNVQIQR